MEVVNVIDISSNLGCKKLAVESWRFRSRSAIQPGPVRKGERFGSLRLLGSCGALRLGVFHLWDQCFVRYSKAGSNFARGGTLRSWLRCRVFFQAFDFCL